MTYKFDAVEDAVRDIAKGKLVIVMDSKDREYEGDFIGAASKATPEMINFMVTHGKGAYIAIFMPQGLCDKFGIPPMGVENTSFNGTKFRMSVDATSNISGSSAFDRAETVRQLGTASSKPSDFVRPGHVVPIEAHPQGLLGRNGHTEAGVELVRMAGIEPCSAVDLEILDDDGQMAHEEKLFAIAKKYDIKIVRIEDVIDAVKRNAASGRVSASR